MATEIPLLGDLYRRRGVNRHIYGKSFSTWSMRSLTFPGCIPLWHGEFTTPVNLYGASS